jgi:DNA-directed RNA polymerase subunit RPC12/RpoP
MESDIFTIIGLKPLHEWALDSIKLFLSESTELDRSKFFKKLREQYCFNCGRQFSEEEMILSIKCPCKGNK